MDDTLFEFLHFEVVNYVIEQNETVNKDSKVSIFFKGMWVLFKNPILQEDDLSNLEYVGFSTGYKIIER